MHDLISRFSSRLPLAAVPSRALPFLSFSTFPSQGSHKDGNDAGDDSVGYCLLVDPSEPHPGAYTSILPPGYTAIYRGISDGYVPDKAPAVTVPIPKASWQRATTSAQIGRLGPCTVCRGQPVQMRIVPHGKGSKVAILRLQALLGTCRRTGAGAEKNYGERGMDDRACGKFTD